MSTRLVSRRLAVVVGALATAVILGGLTGAPPSFADTFTGCLNKGGELKRVAVGTTPLAPCSPNEQQVSWGTGGGLTLYRVTASFSCPSGGGNCQINPEPIAECNAGDLATGGGAYRTGTAIPIQDHPARPYPTLSNDPPTGFTVMSQTIQPGDTMYVVAICATSP